MSNKFKIGNRWVNAREMRKHRDKLLKKNPKLKKVWCKKCGSMGVRHKTGCEELKNN